MNRIYLDYNATAPIRPGVQELVAQALSFGNPSAVHAEGRRARAAVEQARAQVAEFCGGAPEGVVFTSGGTEACNLALGLRAAPAGTIERVLVSATEHAAVRQAATASGLSVEELPVNSDGVIDLAALDSALSAPAPALVCVMAANNETGVLVPVANQHELSNALSKLIQNTGLRARYGRAGRKRAITDFEHKKVIEIYSDFFRLVIDKHKRAD